MTTTSDLPTGFADKVLSAQSVFRSLMDAMSRPGTIHRIVAESGAPTGMMPGTAAVALTLFDQDAPIWLDGRMAEADGVLQWLRFHTGAPIVADSSVCDFALIGDGESLPPLSRFSFGSEEYPDRSTTLIVQVTSLTQGPAFELRGPGIDGAAVLRTTIAPADLFDRLGANAGLFPRGIDVVLVHDDAIVAIPRTTRFTAIGG